VDEFLASPHATGLGLADDVLEDAAFLVAGAAEAFVGHPWRWSPVQVELALTQRIPWATDATDEALRAVEQVLPAFIRYAHQRLAVPRHATHETIAAVDEWMPEFHALCATPAIVSRDGKRSRPAAGRLRPDLCTRWPSRLSPGRSMPSTTRRCPPTGARPRSGRRPPVARGSPALVDVARGLPRVAHLGAVRAVATASHRLLAAAAANDQAGCGVGRRCRSACGLL
jgi:hypothetical protein